MHLWYFIQNIDTRILLQTELHSKLLSVRRELARKLDAPPYMVATNNNLQEMVACR